MSKKLSEMTLEELWQLFPIFLTEHKDYWNDWYEEEKLLLSSILPAEVIISHIGSTAINGIWAKPIVDILIEVPETVGFDVIKNAFVSSGYILMCEEKARLDFNKGYTENGFAEKVFHIHVRRPGDNDEIIFRDYLNAHADVAKEYEKMKLGLWKKFEHNRDGYTDAKTEFIRKWTETAKKEM